MNLALTDDRRMIREAAESFLAEAAASAAVRDAMASTAGYDAKVWQRIGGELGWCGTAIPESEGGLGMGPFELALIVEQAGRRLLPGPFFATVCLAGNVLAQVASRPARKAWLQRIAAGAVRATAAFDAGVTVKKAGKGFVVSGTLDAVVDGATAELVVLTSGGRAFAVAPGKGFAVEPHKTWDMTRRFARVTLRNAAAERVDDGKRGALERARALSRLYLAAEQLGGAQQCLDLAVAFTSERKQFGRAIASFQAIKHRCAQMVVLVESLRSAVYGAAALAGEKTPVAELAIECAAVKALASDTFFHCAGEAIQMHGGVGFTAEFDPQLYFKRAQAMSHWLGAADVLRESVAQALLA